MDAARFRARLGGEPSPAGERMARVLAGRTAVDRGQARPFVAADLAAVLATCHQPRRRGRGVASDDVALKRGQIGHLFVFASVEPGRRWSGLVRRSAARAVVVAEVGGGVVGRSEQLSLPERRIDLDDGRGPEPATVVDLNQEQAGPTRSCVHAPSALSHPFGRGRSAGPSS